MTDLNFTRQSFEFLEGLEQNNNKAWFDDNRETYEGKLRDPFAAVLEQLSERLADAELPLFGSSKTMFRINRDVRFSKDKSPYSTHVSGLMTPGGKKSEAGPIVYLHLGAKGGLTAAGFYKFKASQLHPIRQRILDKAKAFDGVREKLNAAGLTISADQSLKSMPRGFEDAADHRHADILRLKSLIVEQDLPKRAWTDGSIIERVERFARDAMPLLIFGHLDL